MREMGGEKAVTLNTATSKTMSISLFVLRVWRKESSHEFGVKKSGLRDLHAENDSDVMKAEYCDGFMSRPHKYQ